VRIKITNPTAGQGDPPCIGPGMRLHLGCPARGYGHKRARNKRIGPGGGTRRLHQHPSFGDHGAETGSTNV